MAGNTIDLSPGFITSKRAKKIDRIFSNLLDIIPEMMLMCILDKQETVISIKISKGLSPGKINQIRDMIPKIVVWFNKSSLGFDMYEIENHRYAIAQVGANLSVIIISTNHVSIDESLLYCFIVTDKLYRIMNKQDVAENIPFIQFRSSNEVQSKIDRTRHIGIKPDNYIAKLTIIGDAKVGKTSLMRQYIMNTIRIEHEPIGVNIMTKLVQFPDEETTTVLAINDMGGQNQFEQIRKSFFRGAHACFIVFDITDRESFEHVKSWYAQIMQYAGEMTVVLLIGNKMDLTGHRVIGPDEITSLSKELGCLYIETSAKTGENVELAFKIGAMLLLLCDLSEECLIAPPKIKKALSSLINLLHDSNR